MWIWTVGKETDTSAGIYDMIGFEMRETPGGQGLFGVVKPDGSRILINRYRGENAKVEVINALKKIRMQIMTLQEDKIYEVERDGSIKEAE